jgi:RNA polymerase sigma-70 factor (ECF subfamily)
LRIDPEAHAQLYRKYKGRLYSFCLRLLHDRPGAEDAVQNTFLKLCQANEPPEQPEALRCWLFRVARNEALMTLRRQKASPDSEDAGMWDNETPFTILTGMETREIVQTAVAGLRVEYREVILLREYEQLSYAEIADITGTTESSVKSRLFKARKALAAKLQPWFLKGER